MMDPAAIVETHSAVVALVGDRAYKWKKPVRLGFLDFSSLGSRERACRRECTLNRNYSPDVYLGIAEVRDDGGSPCEYILVMRRLPEAARLSTLVGTGRDLSDGVREVVRRALLVHGRGRTPPEGSGWGGPDRLAANWTDNVRTIVRQDAEWIGAGDAQRAGRLAAEYIAGRRDLLRQRAATRVRDGHGDLQATDIFLLPDGPRILDCLDFDDGMRHIDPLDEIAFLAMDLERLGAHELADVALDEYRGCSADPYPASLADHYIAYRAHVRAKVECIRGRQGDGSAGARASQLHRMAIDHLERARVLMVLVGGGPGTGKSTIANALGEGIGATVIRSDEVRAQLVPMPAGTTSGAGVRSSRYAPAMTARTYHELIARAEAAAAAGTSVIVDATWSDATMRARAAAAAGRSTSVLVELRCDAPVELSSARVASRPEAHSSEATPEVARILSVIDPWPDAHVIETTGSIEASVARARAVVAAAVRS